MCLTYEVLKGFDLLLEDMVLYIEARRLLFLSRFLISFLWRHQKNSDVPFESMEPCPLEWSSWQKTAVLVGILASSWPLVLSVP